MVTRAMPGQAFSKASWHSCDVALGEDVAGGDLDTRTKQPKQLRKASASVAGCLRFAIVVFHNMICMVPKLPQLIFKGSVSQQL